MRQNPASVLKIVLFLVLALPMCVGTAHAQASKPHIIVIWGDDIGQSNISAYSKGMMGYRTPHIDRLASEGMMFTDYYGEQSCTAGRSAFITGQSVFRTGLSKQKLRSRRSPHKKRHRLSFGR